MKQISIRFLFLCLLVTLAVCNRPPFTKLDNDKVSGKDVKTALEAYLVPGNLNTAFTNRIILQIITGVEDSKYYTRESLDSCRQNLNLLRILGNDLFVLATCNIKEAPAL
ncbi:hypothetical protein LPTSP4_24630 [Leptospira ryugenii]|uniref:Lipoprotein n=1 Tax=Leptospira ryugenii TaxID=1917863 RepID=A0A2P2E211_9LEPT|nr:TIGR04452 family lipoprotein [Leptospira ryugenii]GBF50935.1 hypothetical protein LPTSP4_24630 [Leptospira ryugenii]